jgi:hypothetical protein
MVYTHKHPALLIMGILFLLIGATTHIGLQDGLVEYLQITKYHGEMTGIAYGAGFVGLIVGLWHLLGSHREGHLDYYLSTVAGVIFILLVAMIIRWYIAPLVAVLSKTLWPVMGAKYLHQVLCLNYVVLGILAGILIVNLFKIPQWAENGIRMSRLGLKTGVILLGTLYSLAELAHLVGRSVNSVTLRAPLLGQGKAHFAGNGCPFQEVQRRIGPVAGLPSGRATSAIGAVMLA